MAYVEQVLVRTRANGDIIFMDNLRPTSRWGPPRTRCRRDNWLLPAHSPHFNPIEMAFSKFKVALRNAPKAVKKLWRLIVELANRLHLTNAPTVFDGRL